MRRTLTFIFTLFYTLVSSGAPALLHFCGHEQNMHLSLVHEDHHSAPSCCHSEVKACHASALKAPSSVDEEDCCISSHIELDESQFETQVFSFVLSIENSHEAYDIPKELGIDSFSANGPVQNNGPPLYLKHQQIIVYS